jgi:hypothetical protein
MKDGCMNNYRRTDFRSKTCRNPEKNYLLLPTTTLAPAFI